MKTQEAQRCRLCSGLELVFTPGMCGNCGATDVDMVELPPKPALKRHQEAYRKRAGMIGELASCICTYPLDINESTLSGCDPRCPRETMARRAVEREEREEARRLAEDPAYSDETIEDLKGRDGQLRKEGERRERKKASALAPETAVSIPPETIVVDDDDLPPWERKRG